MIQSRADRGRDVCCEVTVGCEIIGIADGRLDVGGRNLRLRRLYDHKVSRIAVLAVGVISNHRVRRELKIAGKIRFTVAGLQRWTENQRVR